MPTGETTAASLQAKLYHDVHDPAKTVDMVLELKQNSLISGGKFEDAKYIIVLTPTEVLIYNGNDINISVSKESILWGWRDTKSGLWRVPLQPNAPPPKSDFIFLNKSREEAIANVYQLPSTDKSIRYLHGCACFPTKAYWIEAINGGNYAIWPNLTAEAVKKHSPESNETNQGHMRGIKQIKSTKDKKKLLTYQFDNGETLTIPLQKHQDI